MRGLHLTADLYQCHCEAQWLADAQKLGQWSRRAAEEAGLQVDRDLFHAKPGDGGVSATLLLPHSHVVLHTAPAARTATVDVYLAGDGQEVAATARALMDTLIGRFQPGWTEQRSLDRGDGQ